jgi:zinc protease
MKSLILSLLLLSLPASSLAGVSLNSKGKNPNYLFEEDSKALASSVQLVFRTGSMMDPKGKEGLARVAFRSLLRGTKEKNSKEFFSAVERMGASMDVDIGHSRVIMSLNTVSENLAPALSLLAEAVTEASLKDSDINAVKEEELAQLNQELSNNRKLLKRVFRQALFRGTTLAYPSEGTIESVKAITADDVRSFLKAQVKSGSAIFAVSANLSEKDVRGLIEAAFTNLPDGQPPALPEVKAATPVGRTVYVVDRKGSATTEVGIGHLGIKAARPDREVLEVGLHSFGEDMSSRLFKELREKKGWTYGAYGGFDLFERPRAYGGGFMIWAFPQAEHTEPLVIRALEIYEEYAKGGLTPKELKFSQQALSNSYPFKFATSRSRLQSKLYELLEGAPSRSVPEYRKIVNGITPASLKASIRKAHDPENLVIVLVGDPSRTAAVVGKLKNVTLVKIEDPMKAL